MYRSFIELSKASQAIAEASMVQKARRRFKMWYRLNAECAWQPAMPEGENFADAKIALLLAVKMIYQIKSKNIEIVEHLGAPNDTVAGSDM